MNTTGIITGVVVGLADEYAISYDVKKAYTKPFQNATDIGRAVVVVGGFAMNQFMPRYGFIGAVAAQSAVALLTKSVYAAVKSPAEGTGASFVGRRTASRGGTFRGVPNWVPTYSQGAGTPADMVGYNNLTPSEALLV